MAKGISPEIARVYTQLCWIDSRTFRIQESVTAHFSKEKVQQALASTERFPQPVAGQPEFSTLLDERDPETLLRHLAIATEAREAAVVSALRQHVSIYRDHVDEQILFGARTAGQEAGRAFLSRAKSAGPARTSLELPEAVQAVFALTYTGLPGDRNYFLSLRSLGGCSVHFHRSAHLEAWQLAAADPKFMYAVKAEWVSGILDVLAPGVEFSTTGNLEGGDRYGLAHFYRRGLQAAP